MAAQIPLEQLPGYIQWYCHSSVKRVIESNEVFKGDSWAATRTFLVDLYGSSDKAPVVTADKLWAWIKEHAEDASITQLKDVDKYYRQFLAFSSPLLNDKMLLEYESNLLFYRGIPKPLHEIIKAKIAPEKQKVKAAPTVKETLALLRQEFDKEDIDAAIETTDLNLSSDSSDSDDSDSDDEQYKRKRKAKRDKKKREKGRSTKVVIDDDKDSTGSPAIEELTRQMKDLMINQANFQQQIASQLSNPMSGDRRCYLCDKTGTHRLGITNCPELSALIGEGFVKYNEQGKIVRRDGSPLPRANVGSGGIAKILRDEQTGDKGKARETNEACITGSSYTNHVELLYEGRGVLSNETVGLAFRNNNIAYPVTCQQKKDQRMDPLKRGGEKNKMAEVPSIPDKQQANVIPPQKPQATEDIVMKDVPPKLQPHPTNTEQGWKDQSKAKRQSEPRMNDELNKTKGGGWHFSSIIQDSIDGADVQDRIFNMQVTLMLKEILGMSADLQKRFGNLVRTKRIDNQAKNSLILHDFQHDRDCDQMIQINETTWVNSEEPCRRADVSDTPFVPAKAQLSFDSNNDVMNIMSRYAHSAMVDIPNTLAFTTGQFKARLGGHKIVFMLDTGSELNLISESFFR